MEQQIREGIAKALAMLLTPEAQQVLTASIMLAIALKGAWGVTMFAGRQTARAWRWATTELPPPPTPAPPPLGRVAQAIMSSLAGACDVKSTSKDKDNYDVSNTHGLFAVWRAGLDSIAVKGVNCKKHLTDPEWVLIKNRVGDVIQEHEAQLKRQEEAAVASSLGFLSMHDLMALEGKGEQNDSIPTIEKQQLEVLKAMAKCSGTPKQKSA